MDSLSFSPVKKDPETQKGSVTGCRMHGADSDPARLIPSPVVFAFGHRQWEAQRRAYSRGLNMGT